MSREIIVKMKSGRIKIKDGEYERDLVRCIDCKYHEAFNNDDHGTCSLGVLDKSYPDDFCSYGEEIE